MTLLFIPPGKFRAKLTISYEVFLTISYEIFLLSCPPNHSRPLFRSNEIYATNKKPFNEVAAYNNDIPDNSIDSDHISTFSFHFFSHRLNFSSQMCFVAPVFR